MLQTVCESYGDNAESAPIHASQERIALKGSYDKKARVRRKSTNYARYKIVKTTLKVAWQNFATRPFIIVRQLTADLENKITK